MLRPVGYPFLFEPWFSNPQQSSWWSAAIALFALLCRASRGDARPPPLAARTARSGRRHGAAAARARIALWLALSRHGLGELLAVSNHLTQNISSIPLLWVIPLASTCSRSSSASRAHLVPRDSTSASLVWILCVMAWFLADKTLQFELLWHVLVFTVGLFFVCMFCHGELARLRPGPRHLTLFYLVVSLGGVLGGVLVGIVAPVTLPAYLELEIALVVDRALAIVVQPRPAAADPGAAGRGGRLHLRRARLPRAHLHRGHGPHRAQLLRRAAA
jgi:hypothetical protein